jgi:glycosyltransferase involved in cell wall biosynthesis
MTTRSHRPHVAVLIDFAVDLGGAETLAFQLLERIDPARFRRTLVLYQELDDRLAPSQRNVVKQMHAAGVEVLELGRRDRFDLRAWRPFLRLLRAGDVDILHAHKFGPNVWATLLGRVARVPVVIAHEHTWDFKPRSRRALVDRWVVAPGCDAFVAVSELDRERMRSVEGIPPWRIRFLPNGIPPVQVDGEPAEVRAELGIPDGAPIVGAVGVFRPQKDFPTLLRAHARLLEHHPDARLVIVGYGPEEQAIKRFVEKLGIGERVVLTGLRGDAIRIAAAFDVAVNSSLFEGSSLAIIEFMALGRPIVATAVGGTPDLLAHGKAGMLVAPSEPAVLADAIGGLFDDPAGAAALGARARERQRAEYDIDAQARRLQELYDELLAQAPARRGRFVRHRPRSR